MKADPLPREPTPDDSLIVYLVVRKDLKMGPGKIGAQCGHAVQLLDMEYRKFCENGAFWDTLVLGADIPNLHKRITLWESMEENGRFTKIVLGAHDKDWFKLKEIYDPIIVIDAGKTEIAPDSATIMILPPMFKDERHPLLKRQRLL